MCQRRYAHPVGVNDCWHSNSNRHLGQGTVKSRNKVTYGDEPFPVVGVRGWTFGARNEIAAIGKDGGAESLAVNGKANHGPM
jgi:hypothetical protein